jgi:integrative and conjugative element protein (TIGR02256 family)
MASLGNLCKLSPCRCCMIEYPIGTSGQTVVFSERVVSHFNKCRQTRFWHREAGGQLFARLSPGFIVISICTGPRSTDRRTRTSYIPDRRAEQIEIEEQHVRGLHYVGDWHTHPHIAPQPSARDVASIRDCFVKSRHSLNGFLLAIVGQRCVTSALHVSIHDASYSYTLDRARSEDTGAEVAHRAPITSTR